MDELKDTLQDMFVPCTTCLLSDVNIMEKRHKFRAVVMREEYMMALKEEKKKTKTMLIAVVHMCESLVIVTEKSRKDIWAVSCFDPFKIQCLHPRASAVDVFECVQVRISLLLIPCPS